MHFPATSVARQNPCYRSPTCLNSWTTTPTYSMKSPLGIPIKVKLALEHVDKNSFWFDMKILVQTFWMLTLGRLWSIREHPDVAELKKKLRS